MRRSRLLLPILLAALLAAGTYLTVARATNAPAPETVTYCSPGGRPLAMDIWRPERSSGRTVIYVHGGAWSSGSRRDTGDLFPQLRPRLLSAGDLVVAIDYRLAPTAPWPAPLEDTRCALSYLAAHAAQLGIDPARIGLYGTSAGGQIVAVAGLDRSPGVDRVVDMYGPADLTAAGWSSWLRADIRTEFGAQAPAASPVAHAAAGAPPFLIVQGDCDAIVPVGQSRELVSRLRTAGAAVQYVEVHDAGHAFGSCGGGPSRPSAAQVLDRVAGFLNS